MSTVLFAKALRHLPEDLRAPAQELYARAQGDLPDVPRADLLDLIVSQAFRPILVHFARDSARAAADRLRFGTA